MRALLISTYELGRQPFGLASPAAWLAERGFSVLTNDLSVEALDEDAARRATLIGVYVPMHTATRLAARLIPRLVRSSPRAHIACYGLYAPMNSAFLKGLGAHTILGGEFEEGLARLASRLARHGAATSEPIPEISLERQRFLVPLRDALPPLERYARLHVADGESRLVGYTEASRGCKHLCRHCPVVPVYNGRFRIVDRQVVIDDIRGQFERGARHITFGDPDFLNAPRHALAVVTDLHREMPQVSYDVTVKVEHLLRHAELLPQLRATGCLFVTTAVETLDDAILTLLDKGHTARDFERALETARGIGLHLVPTLVPFTPWTSIDGYRRLLDRFDELDLVESVAPIQLAIRLLIPSGSRLLELPDVRPFLEGYDEEKLSWRWTHRDAAVDRLCGAAQQRVKEGERAAEPRRRIFDAIRSLADEAAGRAGGPTGAKRRSRRGALPRAPIPYLTEPWYC